MEKYEKMIKKLIEIDEEEEKYEDEEEEEEKKEEKIIKKEEKKHKPGDIETIFDIVGFRVWKNEKEYIDLPIEQRGIAELLSIILKAISK